MGFLSFLRRSASIKWKAIPIPQGRNETTLFSSLPRSCICSRIIIKPGVFDRRFTARNGYDNADIHASWFKWRICYKEHIVLEPLDIGDCRYLSIKAIRMSMAM
jgi:hypothetical protein